MRLTKHLSELLSFIDSIHSITQLQRQSDTVQSVSVHISHMGHVCWIKYLNKLCIHFIVNQLTVADFFLDQPNSLWFVRSDAAAVAFTVLILRMDL